VTGCARLVIRCWPDGLRVRGYGPAIDTDHQLESGWVIVSRGGAPPRPRPKTAQRPTQRQEPPMDDEDDGDNYRFLELFAAFETSHYTLTG
jgi:hypothetical protein